MVLLLMAETPQQLSQVVADMVALLRALRFTIHDTKSVMTPTQIAKFVGFILNSKNMTISMIPEKADIVQSKCQSLTRSCSNPRGGLSCEFDGILICRSVLWAISL